MKQQSGIPYNLPTVPPTQSLKRDAVKIDVYRQTHGYEVFQYTGDNQPQRLAMTFQQMDNFLQLMYQAGFKEV